MSGPASRLPAADAPPDVAAGVDAAVEPVGEAPGGVDTGPEPLSAAGPGAAGGGGKKRARNPPSPAQRALGLLVRREHSQRELERKLTARGVTRDEARAAVERMAEAGWQDDGRFAASLARARAVAGYGPQRIRVELESHGLDAAIIDAAFDVLAEDGDDGWLERARDLVGRRFPAPDDEEREAGWQRRRKAAEFLLRRGFDMETVRRATSFAVDD